MTLREALDRPRITHMAVFRIGGPDADAVMREARVSPEAALVAAISEPDLHVLPAQPAPIERIRGRWRWQVHISARQQATLGALIARAMTRLDDAKLPASLQVALDVDPIELPLSGCQAWWAREKAGGACLPGPTWRGRCSSTASSSSSTRTLVPLPSSRRPVPLDQDHVGELVGDHGRVRVVRVREHVDRAVVALVVAFHGRVAPVPELLAAM